MSRKKKKKPIRVTYTDYERYNESRKGTRLYQDLEKPVRALSNPRLDACNEYFEETKVDNTPISVIYKSLGKRYHRPKARIILTPMGGKNKL
jgi:hypothetical protein